jgi:hypothetical protein
MLKKNIGSNMKAVTPNKVISISLFFEQCGGFHIATYNNKML